MERALLLCTGEATSGYWDQFGAPRDLQSRMSLGTRWQWWVGASAYKEKVEELGLLS